jgi:hypothetical protein
VKYLYETVKGVKRKGNFRNMRMYMQGDNEGWVKYGSRNKHYITVNMKLKLDMLFLTTLRPTKNITCRRIDRFMQTG